jgi:hypothetical protein
MYPEGAAWVTATFNLSTAALTDETVKTSYKEPRHYRALYNPQEEIL